MEKLTNVEKIRIELGLLESVERDGEQSQRRLASELDVALGLVNAYLKRCVNKGLVKMRSVPARRYAYFLTPRGFSEKSRLTVEYLSFSFSSFRQAKLDYAEVLEAARARGFLQVVLLGVSDLTEIAAICALDTGVQIIAVVDAACSMPRVAGLSVVNSFDELVGHFDAVIVTEIKATRKVVEAAVERFGAKYVLVPKLLGGPSVKRRGVTA